MKNIFEPSDFILHGHYLIRNSEAAEAANNKLNKLIESWSVVYNYFESNLGKTWQENEDKNFICNYKARLAFIEPIKRGCMKHEPLVPSYNVDTICKHCKVEIVAEWKEKT